MNVGLEQAETLGVALSRPSPYTELDEQVLAAGAQIFNTKGELLQTVLRSDSDASDTRIVLLRRVDSRTGLEVEEQLALPNNRLALVDLADRERDTDRLDVAVK